jgi:hypothetical protein
MDFARGQGWERGNGEIASRLASLEFASGRSSIARRIASRAFVEPVGTTFFLLSVRNVVPTLTSNKRRGLSLNG